MAPRMDRPLLREAWRGYEPEDLWSPRSDVFGYGAANSRRMNGLQFLEEPRDYFDTQPENRVHGGYELPGEYSGKIEAQDIAAKRGGGAAPTVREMTAYIREAARARGIDPNIAVRVARSEGLAPNTWQSRVPVGGGRHETSYGPYQLLVGGGLGDQFIKLTGKSPADKSTWQQQVDFALDYAADNGWGSWYGAAKVGVGKWTGLKGAQPIGLSQTAEAPGEAQAETVQAAGGLGALFSGGWVEPMVAAYQQQEAAKPSREFQRHENFVGPQAMDRLLSPKPIGVPAASQLQQGKPFAIPAATGGGLAPDPTGVPVSRVQTSTIPAGPQQPYGVPSQSGFLLPDPNARIAGATALTRNAAPPMAPERMAPPAASPLAWNAPLPSRLDAKGDRLVKSAPPPPTMATASVNPYADPRAAAYASGIKPGTKQVVTPQSMLNAAKTFDRALGPLGTNIMRVVDAVRSPSARLTASTSPTTTSGYAAPIRRESKGQPGGNYAGSGLSATSAVRSGTTPVGTIAHSRSDPSVSLVSLPGGRVAHVNDKHGFISTWSPADDDELGTTYGKTLAIDPAGSKYGYFSAGKVPTGWATYSPGKGFSKGIAAVSNARSYGPGIFGGLGKGKSGASGKSSGPSLGGFLSGLFGGRGVAPGKSLGNQAVGQAVGLAAGLFGPAGGMGGLGMSGGFGGPGVGGLGAPGFGGQISSNTNYGGR